MWMGDKPRYEPPKQPYTDYAHNPVGGTGSVPYWQRRAVMGYKPSYLGGAYPGAPMEDTDFGNPLEDMINRWLYGLRERGGFPFGMRKPSYSTAPYGVTGGEFVNGRRMPVPYVPYDSELLRGVYRHEPLKKLSG